MFLIDFFLAIRLTPIPFNEAHNFVFDFDRLWKPFCLRTTSCKLTAASEPKLYGNSFNAKPEAPASW